MTFALSTKEFGAEMVERRKVQLPVRSETLLRRATGHQGQGRRDGGGNWLVHGLVI
jgi:hypothetical protein